MSNYFLYRNAWIYDNPPNKESFLDKTEVKALLNQGGLMVRNTYDFDTSTETYFWFVINDKYRGIEDLLPRVRNKIRRADQFFEYRLADYGQFVKNVFPIFEDTVSSYKVHDRKMNSKVFSDFLEQSRQKTYDYWGIFLKDTDQMVGFCMVKKWDNCCEIWNVGVLSEYKSEGYYPYYGLYHHLNEYYLNKKGYSYISDGSRTITNHSEIHDWLMHYFGFRKAYCKLKLHYKWWFGIIVRLLYPFRNIIPNRNIQAVLKMHGMQTL